MENFYSWMMKPVNREDVEIWFNINNMIYEKRQLFSDFTFSLYDIIKSTYLGDDVTNPSETKIILSQQEKESHFEWCWNKTLENFSKENIKFNLKGEHKDYYEKFYFIFDNRKDTGKGIKYKKIEVYGQSKFLY